MRFMTFSSVCGALFLLVVSCLSYANQNVLMMLNDDYLHKKKFFEDKITECKNNRRVIEFKDDQVEYLRKIGIYHSEILKAVGYFSGRNRYLCSEREQIDFYLSSGRLKTAKEMYKQPYDDEENMQFLTLYPDIKNIESSLEYSPFSQEAKDFFEKIFGIEPFDFMKAVRSVDKYREEK